MTSDIREFKLQGARFKVWKPRTLDFKLCTLNFALRTILSPTGQIAFDTYRLPCLVEAGETDALGEPGERTGNPELREESLLARPDHNVHRLLHLILHSALLADP